MTLTNVLLIAQVLLGIQIAFQYDRWRRRDVEYRMFPAFIAVGIVDVIAFMVRTPGSVWAAFAVVALTLIYGMRLAYGPLARLDDRPTRSDSATDTSGFE